MKFHFPRIKRFGERAVIPFENGAELFRVKSTATDQDVKMQQEISFDIAFEEPGIIQAQPVIPALDELATFMARTLDAFLPFFPDTE